MDHDLTFQQIKDSVELPELLTHYGYNLDKGENLNKGKWHVFKGDDTLVVFKGRGNDWMYYNTQDDRDKGSVIDWMKNRVSSGRIAGIQQEPGRNLWQSVNDHFRAYLNLPEAQRPKLELAPVTPIEPNTRIQSLYLKNCTALTDTSYLESRGITKETLNNPQFTGRILNQHHTVQREGMPAKTYVNTAFPAYHEGKIVGLELKGQGFKGQAPDGDFARSLWLSKEPEGGRRATTLVVSESGIDTLSYAQMHPQERAIYASTAGVLTGNKIWEMKRVMAAEGLTTIKSAFDNDTPGCHYDTRLIAGFAGEQNPMKVVREHKHLLTVEITPSNPAGVQAMAQQLRAFNAQVTQQYQQASGEQPSQAVLPTLRDELIATTRSQANTYQFHLPMNREALSAFNQAAVQHLQFEQKIELVKSHSNDWNQELKDTQMQAVVKRELGPAPVNEDQYGFGQEHWKNDPVQGVGKITQFQQDTQAARDKGERLLVVEFRESRDEMSQLMAMQQRLEKAGLVVDHSVRLEPLAPRELATELTLRYTASSPQLVTISQALDGLASNPKVKVIEPQQDATERRQLATAQEQAQQKQQQQQMQPSESAAHDQARQVFIQAAGPLAKELREAGAGLDAGRLQEVSKYLVKQPELRKTDVENITKVLAVLDKSPALKDRPEVQQVRQAMQVLDKPVQGYEQRQQQQQKPEAPAQERKRGPRL